MGRVVACSEHPGRDAPYYCAGCAAYACGDCATETEAGGRQLHVCKRCGGLMAMASGTERTGTRRLPPLWQRIPDIVSYFGRRSVWMVIVAMAVLWWALRWVPFGGILMAGIEAAVFFRILETTAFGEDDLDPPDFRNAWDDLFSPLMRYFAAVLPIIIAIVWGAVEFFATLRALKSGSSPSEVFGGMTGPIALLFCGVALLPLFFAVAAIGRSVIAMFNPVVWFRSIRTMGVEYLVGSILFYAALAAEVFVLFPLALRALLEIDIVFVGPVLAATIMYVPMVLQARILGAMCEPYMDTGTEAARVAEEALPAARTVVPGQPAPPPPRVREPVDFAPNPAPASPGHAPSAPVHDLGQPVHDLGQPVHDSASAGPGPAQMIDLPPVDEAAILVADAKHAYESGDDERTVQLAGLVLTQNPRSPEVLNALWLAAHAQQRAGRLDLMEKSLRMLLQRAGSGPLADRVRAKLQQHGLGV